MTCLNLVVAQFFANVSLSFFLCSLSSWQYLQVSCTSLGTAFIVGLHLPKPDVFTPLTVKINLFGVFCLISSLAQPGVLIPQDHCKRKNRDTLCAICFRPYRQRLGNKPRWIWEMQQGSTNSFEVKSAGVPLRSGKSPEKSMDWEGCTLWKPFTKHSAFITVLLSNQAKFCNYQNTQLQSQKTFNKHLSSHYGQMPNKPNQCFFIAMTFRLWSQKQLTLIANLNSTNWISWVIPPWV